MNKQREKTAWLVVAAALVVVGVLMLLFRVIFRDRQESSIVLPAQTAAAPAEEPAQEPAREQSTLVTVTPENLSVFLQELTAPEACYQAFTVTLTAGDATRVRQVRLWKKAEETKAVITDEASGTEKHLLARGDSLWVWYAGSEEGALTGTLEGTRASLQALSSLPERDTFLSQWTGYITETVYQVLDTGEAAILVRGEKDETGEECRISAETGLVLSDRRWDGDGTWYEAQQEEYRLLTPADEDYTAAFALPQDKQ